MRLTSKRLGEIKELLSPQITRAVVLKGAISELLSGIDTLHREVQTWECGHKNYKAQVELMTKELEEFRKLS